MSHISAMEDRTIDWEQQRAWVEIDLSALKHNVRQIKSLLAANTTIMAVVKADAYGHGAIDIARTIIAEGVEWLAVATVTEGIQLRTAGIVAPILILGAVNSDVQVQAIAQWDLTPTICTVQQAIIVSNAIAKLQSIAPSKNIHPQFSQRLKSPLVMQSPPARTKSDFQSPDFTVKSQLSWKSPPLAEFVRSGFPTMERTQAGETPRPDFPLPTPNSLNVHLKLDTGMSRLGTDWQQAVDFFDRVNTLPHLQIGGLYSHLATADEIDSTVMEMQLDRFEKSVAAIAAAGHVLPLLHLANSAGILASDRLHYQLVRPGLILYGICPAPHLQSSIDLQPVLSVRARITQVKDIVAGTGVSYGYRYIADRDIRLAVVEIGYADGIPRRLSNQMQVAIRGKLVTQIGSITMDRIMLDVSQIPDLQVGEIVTILGQDGTIQITADDWANQLGTISWEILCGFKHRLPRISG
jgi:alanine racemase